MLSSFESLPKQLSQTTQRQAFPEVKNATVSPVLGLATGSEIYPGVGGLGAYGPVGGRSRPLVFPDEMRHGPVHRPLLLHPCTQGQLVH